MTTPDSSNVFNMFVTPSPITRPTHHSIASSSRSSKWRHDSAQLKHKYQDERYGRLFEHIQQKWVQMNDKGLAHVMFDFVQQCVMDSERIRGDEQQRLILVAFTQKVNVIDVNEHSGGRLIW